MGIYVESGEAEEVRGVWGAEAKWGFTFCRKMNTPSSMR